MAPYKPATIEDEPEPEDGHDPEDEEHKILSDSVQPVQRPSTAREVERGPRGNSDIDSWLLFTLQRSSRLSARSFRDILHEHRLQALNKAQIIQNVDKIAVLHYDNLCSDRTSALYLFGLNLTAEKLSLALGRHTHNLTRVCSVVLG